jgi:hypothetical protein
MIYEEKLRKGGFDKNHGTLSTTSVVKPALFMFLLFLTIPQLSSAQCGNHGIRIFFCCQRVPFFSYDKPNTCHPFQMLFSLYESLTELSIYGDN